MSRLLFCSALLTLGLSLGFTVVRPGGARADMIKLDMLLKACAGKTAVTRGDCTGYIAGVADSMESQHAICIPAGAELKNVRELVVAYLQSHKPEGDTKALAAVGDALKAGYGCKQ